MFLHAKTRVVFVLGVPSPPSFIYPSFLPSFPPSSLTENMLKMHLFILTMHTAHSLLTRVRACGRKKYEKLHGHGENGRGGGGGGGGGGGRFSLSATASLRWSSLVRVLDAQMIL